jgi:hypothetical protein
VRVVVLVEKYGTSVLLKFNKYHNNNRAWWPGWTNGKYNQVMNLELFFVMT